MTPSTGKPLTVEVVTQEIIELARSEVRDAELTADTSLQSGGLDSVRVLSLIFKIEKRYSIVLDEEGGDDLVTVGDLAALVVLLVEAQR
jgi:acyl carrier protein